MAYEQVINNKNIKAKIEINLDSNFCICGASKVVESSDKKIVLKINSTNLIIDGEKLEITNIDPETKTVKGIGSVTKFRYIKSKILSRF